VPTLRESLLAALAAGLELESELAAACDDLPPEEPDRWTAKDHLAHVAHYRDYAADVLDAVRTAAPIPDDAEVDLEERNARIFAKNRHLPAAEVRDWASASRDRLARAVERCSDDHLVQPRSPGSEVAVWRLVPGSGSEHAGLHVAYWHLERGDLAAADAAARRVHEVETTCVDDVRHGAGATYNLGCFLATTGRPDEALALVRQALDQAPDLRDWAEQDPDLVSIRHLLAR
jgi:tetratricopeptide (TPR) repeat protein